MNTKDKQILLNFIGSDEDVLIQTIDFNFLMEVVEKIKKVSNEDDFLEGLNTNNSMQSRNILLH